MTAFTHYKLPTEFFGQPFSLSESDFRYAVPGDPCRCVFTVGIDNLISSHILTRRGEKGVIQFDINVSDKGCVLIAQTYTWDYLILQSEEQPPIFYYAKITPTFEARELIQLFDSGYSCSYHEYQKLKMKTMFDRFKHVKWGLERLPEPCSCCFTNYVGNIT